MADNLEDNGSEFEDIQPIYEDDTRVFEPDPPEQNYTLDEYEEQEAARSGMNWLLVGLVALAAVVTGLLIYYFLFNNGGGGSVISPPPATPTGDPSWTNVRTKGRLVVGTSLDYPPFAYRNQQFQPDGFDMAVISDIAGRLGVGTEIKDMAFDSLGDAINLGQIDVAIAAISVTPEREELVDFSNVYWIGEEGFLARTDSAITSITTLSQMAGHRIGVQRGSVYETWLQRDLVDSGLTQASNLFVYETVDAAVRDLREQRLDLAVLDVRVAEASVAQGGLKLVGRGLLSTSRDPAHKQKTIYSLTEPAIQLVPLLAQMGAWGRRYTPATRELSVRAQLLEEGGSQMWQAFMAELRHLHLGAELPQRSVVRELTEAYRAAVDG